MEAPSLDKEPIFARIARQASGVLGIALALFALLGLLGLLSKAAKGEKTSGQLISELIVFGFFVVSAALLLRASGWFRRRRKSAPVTPSFADVDRVSRGAREAYQPSYADIGTRKMQPSKREAAARLLPEAVPPPEAQPAAQPASMATLVTEAPGQGEAPKYASDARRAAEPQEYELPDIVTDDRATPGRRALRISILVVIPAIIAGGLLLPWLDSGEPPSAQTLLFMLIVGVALLIRIYAQAMRMGRKRKTQTGSQAGPEGTSSQRARVISRRNLIVMIGGGVFLALGGSVSVIANIHSPTGHFSYSQLFIALAGVFILFSGIRLLVQKRRASRSDQKQRVISS